MALRPSTSAIDHSQVVVFPPVIPLSGFLLGVLLQVVWPITHLLNGTLRADLRVLGGGLLAVGTAGFAWMVVTMKKAGTPAGLAVASTRAPRARRQRDRHEASTHPQTRRHPRGGSGVSRAGPRQNERLREPRLEAGRQRLRGGR